MATQKKCLGVEISPDRLKLALVEPERKKIIKVDSIPTSDDSINDASLYASVLGSWARSHLLSKVNSVAVVFPSSSCVMRLVDIPKEINALDYVNWEFASAVNAEAGDFRLDTAFYPNPKKPARAIVTAMRKKHVESFCSEELDKSGFKPDLLIADICALLNLLEFSEGLSSQPKCILKADEKFIIAFWGNKTGPLAIRVLPKDFISQDAILEILESGFNEFPKLKRTVKFCGELSTDLAFAHELTNKGKELSRPITIKTWISLSKFSLEKHEDFSKLPQCLGAVGATLSCA